MQQQQQQQLTLKEGANSISKEIATWESKAGVRDETKKNATEMEKTAGNSMRTVSKEEVGTHLSEQEVITDALSNNEANTQELERLKTGSNKFAFAKSQQQTRWCQAKNQAVLSWRWVTWD